MDDRSDEIILCAALMHGIGMHLGAWQVRDGEAGDYVSPEYFMELARVAEAAKTRRRY
jgi:hypothetical protein